MDKVKKIVIFVLFLQGCSEEHELTRICSPFRMTISDAIPVQFWVNGIETYNQKEVCGITPACFCQPFNCDDDIRIQFESGTELNEADFSGNNGEQYSQSSQSSSIADWNLPTMSVLMDVSHPVASEVAYVENFLTEGETYNFDYAVGGNGNYTAGGGNALSVTLAFFDSNFSILAGSASLMSANGVSKAQSGTASVTVPVGAVYFGFLVSAATISAGSYTITIGFLSIDLNDAYDLVIIGEAGQQIASLDFGNIANGIYELSFVPEELGICDEQIRLKIVDSGGDLALSDCLDVRTSHDCTELFTYRNSKDFADIDYSSMSPSTEFKIRVPAIFFHEENPEELEDMETSGQTIVRLRNEIKVKKRLELGYMPDYMHRKMMLVLAHDTIENGGESWVRRDPYEKVPPSNKRFPLKMANVLLTLQGYIKRNIL